MMGRKGPLLVNRLNSVAFWVADLYSSVLVRYYDSDLWLALYKPAL